jgi:hypothetical protein
MYRKKKVKIEWSPNFAYVIGIITTDGNLSNNKRHVIITSKDREIISKSMIGLNIKNKIGVKARGGSRDKKYFTLQFGDVNFYHFLLKIGLMPAKSKKLKALKIPSKYFADFLRGCIDGDGSISISKHPESRHPQLKVRLYSASLDFTLWMMKKIKKLIKCKGGWIYTPPKKIVHGLSFGKEDSVKILKFVYYDNDLVCLNRKRNIFKEWASGAIG